MFSSTESVRKMPPTARSSGTKASPSAMASDGARMLTGLPSTRMRAARRRRDAEERARHVGAAGADEAAEADDLAVAGPRSRCRRRRPAGSGPRPRGRPRRSVAPVLCRNSLSGRPIIRRMMSASSSSPMACGRDLAAVAEDRDAVAERAHLLEPVGDEDDGAALVAQPPHDREQRLDLLAASAARSARP